MVTSTEPQPFQCPTCGASLPAPDAETVQCEYCESKVLVPIEYLPEEPAENSYAPDQVIIQIGQQTEEAQTRVHRSVKRIITFVILLTLVIFLGTILIIAASLFATNHVVQNSLQGQNLVGATTEVDQALQNQQEMLEEILAASTTTPTPIAATFAELVLLFGSEGSGAGKFDDPRQIAVDPTGNIYVADFNTGRVQKFDPSGTFQWLAIIEPGDNQSKAIIDLAADYSGRLFVIRGGDILILNAADGGLVDKIEGNFPETYFNALAVDPSNHIYTLSHSMTGNDLIKLDPDGNVIFRSRDIISSVNPETPAEDDILSVDGLGNSYVLSVFEPQVYIYNSQGVYQDRFGSQTEGPGQLRNPDHLSVDSQTRIYVTDSGSIDIFDSTGAYLDQIEWDYTLGSPRDLVLDLQDNVYIVTSNGLVLKYVLNWNK